MFICVKFTKTINQIWSCHVTLASNSEHFYFSPNSILNFRKVTKLGGNWLKNKKLQAKNKLGVENTPRAYRIKLQLHDAIYRLRFYSNSLIHILSLSNSHNNVAAIQKNRGDKSHSVIVALPITQLGALD